jgi:5-methylcytosine-specific restriction endonuclease McrA
MIKLPRFDGELTRFEVFNRDQHTCQYYGKETRQLTLDHVISHHQGGEHTWENVASALVYLLTVVKPVEHLPRLG